MMSSAFNSHARPSSKAPASHRPSAAGPTSKVVAEFISRHRLPSGVVSGIDPIAEVREVRLLPGMHCLAFRADPMPGPLSWNAYGLFFTEVGAQPQDLGVRPLNRVFWRLVLTKRTPALRWRTLSAERGAPMGTPRYLRPVSGWNLLIPAASECLHKV